MLKHQISINVTYFNILDGALFFDRIQIFLN